MENDQFVGDIILDPSFTRKGPVECFFKCCVVIFFVSGVFIYFVCVSLLWLQKVQFCRYLLFFLMTWEWRKVQKIVHYCFNSISSFYRWSATCVVIRWFFIQFQRQLTALSICWFVCDATNTWLVDMWLPLCDLVLLKATLMIY